jgi:uncharacterized membrane protein HdeD (DUF308 family)
MRRLARDTVAAAGLSGLRDTEAHVFNGRHGRHCMNDGTTAAVDVSANWRWFAALGVGLLALGLVAWVDATAVTVASAVVIGGSLIAAGVFHIVYAVVAGRWRGIALSLCSGILYAIAGLVAMREPVHGAAVLTLVLVMTIAIGGVLRIATIVHHGNFRQWRLLLLGGIASIVIGALIYVSLPWPGLWVLATLIGIELFIQGSGWLYLGLLLRAG